MLEKHLPFGTMKENDGLIIVDIPKSDTNIADTEQLEELKREEPFFFSCQHYIEDANSIHIYYKPLKDYEPLASVEWSEEKKKQIAKQILQAEKMNGTQYTTSFDPENIYVNQEGAVKFAHRGIRSIIPPEALSGAAFLQEVKRFLIYLYTNLPFTDIDMEAVSDHDNRALINKIMPAGSVGELKDIIEEIPVVDKGNSEADADSGQGIDTGSEQVMSSQTETDVAEQSSSLGLGKEPPSTQPHDSTPLGDRSPVDNESQSNEAEQPGIGLANHQQQKTLSKPKQKEKQKKEGKSKKQTNPLIIGLFGFVCGLLVLYLFQVMPLDKEKEKLEASYSHASAETDSLEDDKDALEDEVDSHQRIEEAYRLALQDEKGEAISILEEINPLNDEQKDTLTGWYMDVGSLDNLQKALELENGHEAEIATKLAKLDDDDARDVIQTMNSSEPGVILEQAWLDDDYDEVISVYKDDLKDNTRAKYLAAKSYIEIDKPDEAKKLGESLNNKDVQISALKKEKKLIKDDDDMDKKDKKDKTKKIDKKIKKLKK